jgi:hypothetical protein
MDDEPTMYEKFMADINEVIRYIGMAIIGFVLFFVIFRYLMGTDTRSSIYAAIIVGAIWALIAWFGQIIPEKTLHDFFHRDLLAKKKRKKK